MKRKVTVSLPELVITMALGVLSSIIAYFITFSVKVGVETCAALVLLGSSVFYVSRLRATISSVSQSGIVRVFDRQEDCIEIMRSHVQTTSAIDIWGVRALGILALNDSVLKKAIIQRSGTVRMRVLLLHPDSSFASVRANEIRDEPKSFRHGILLGITSIRELAAQTKNPVEIKLFDGLPVWRVIAFDDRMFVSQYLTNAEGHEVPVYELSSEPAHSLFFAIRRCFEDAWKAAVVVDSTASSYLDRSPQDANV